jgi:hypothetical protein
MEEKAEVTLIIEENVRSIEGIPDYVAKPLRNIVLLTLLQEPLGLITPLCP